MCVRKVHLCCSQVCRVHPVDGREVAPFLLSMTDQVCSDMGFFNITRSPNRSSPVKFISAENNVSSPCVAEQVDASRKCVAECLDSTQVVRFTTNALLVFAPGARRCV